MSRRPLLLTAASVVVAGTVAGCTVDPAPAPSPAPTSTRSATPLVDADAERLEERVAELRATIAALRRSLEAAADGDTAALDTAAALLVADVPAVTDAGSGTDGADADAADAPTGTTTGLPEGTAPLLPGPLTSRGESFSYGDLLTRTLADARSAGGTGAGVLRFLADPVAGDLGAWQRAPDDQLATIARAGTAGDLETTQTAVLELTGEAPRALGWVVHGLTVPADADTAAARALAHLAVIEIALQEL